MTSSETPWFILEWARKIGYVFRVRIPYPAPIIVVGDPVLAREILNDPSTTKPFDFYGPIDVPIGATNMLTANGERWRHARKATAPAFAKSQIERMNQVCKEKLEDWIQRRMNVFCQDDQPFDPAEEMLFLSLSIICEAAFEYEMKREEAKIFLYELDLVITEYELKQTTNPLRGTWLGYLFAYSEIRRAEQASKKLRDIMDKILQMYRKNQTTTSSKGTLIEYIVNNPLYVNDKERIGDMAVYLVAGHDATAYTLAWTLLELARNPLVLDSVRTQLASMANEEERLKCSALDHVIKEAMRLYPAAAIGGFRETHRDFAVDDTITIPKGSVIFIAPLLSHRNPLYFDQPDEFRPERWNTAQMDVAGVAFMPFVAGPRNCAGQALATAEIRTVLARLVSDYDFEVKDPGKPDWTLSWKPLGALVKARRI
jgi:cytochrome P450